MVRMSDPRVEARAANVPAEESSVGAADAEAQAAAILADSDERQYGRKASGEKVEHRASGADGETLDRY
jgi:hypothetical protein